MSKLRMFVSIIAVVLLVGMTVKMGVYVIDKAEDVQRGIACVAHPESCRR